VALGPHFDRDFFHSMSTKAAARATIKVLDAVQYVRPEEAIAGLSAAFLLITERYGVSAQTAFLAASNMMNHHDHRGASEFDAARSYLDADVFGTRPNF
jgi:hypothetical protein